MRKLAIMTALITSPAIAHKVEPETQFFKDEVKKNPLIQQVIAWCSLVGLDEVTCKEEMYQGNTISEAKVEGASKCIEKSGLEFRVKMDGHFKDSLKKHEHVSHAFGATQWHSYYLVDPAHPKEKPHRHFYTDVDLKEAANQKGDEYVERLKRDHAKDTVTEIKSTEGTATAGASGLVVHGEGSITKSAGTEVTKAPLTAEQIAEARKKGEEYGRAHPEATAVVPHGICEKGGMCSTPNSQYPNVQEDAKREEVAKEVQDPKPVEAPKEEPKPKEEEPKDPFAPFTSESDTGAASNSDEKSAETSKPDDEKDKGVTTPVNDPKFALDMMDCTKHEENKWLKDQGSKTTDSDAKSEDEKKTEALERLKDGYCDEAILGQKFCFDWKNEQAKTHAENAEEEKKAAYDAAMEDFKATGNCNEAILGYEFCKAAKNELDSHRPQETEPETSTIWDTWTPPNINPMPDDPIPATNGYGVFGPEPAPSGPGASADCERNVFGECIIE